MELIGVNVGEGGRAYKTNEVQTSYSRRTVFHCTAQSETQTGVFSRDSGITFVSFS